MSKYEWWDKPVDEEKVFHGNRGLLAMLIENETGLGVSYVDSKGVAYDYEGKEVEYGMGMPDMR